MASTESSLVKLFKLNTGRLLVLASSLKDFIIGTFRGGSYPKVPETASCLLST